MKHIRISGLFPTNDLDPGMEPHTFWDIEMNWGLGTLSQKYPETWDRVPHPQVD